MSILRRDLKWRGSAVMPEDDVTTAIGGALDDTRKVQFVDVAGLVQAVSSNAGDTTQTLTITYRSGSSVLEESKTLNGTTPRLFTASMPVILKAVLSAPAAGVVAIEAQTAARTGTLAAGSADTATLDAGASGTSETYTGYVLRLTSGTGSGQIREGIDYTGSTKVLTVGEVFGTAPGAATGFRLAKGLVFDQTPSPVVEVRRVFYGVSADAAAGVERALYEKVFALNAHGSIDLTSAEVAETADPSTLVTFGVAQGVDDDGTNGVNNNRFVAPPSMAFDSSTKDVPSGTLEAGSAIGVWLRLDLAAGEVAGVSTYLPQLVGDTV